MKKLVLLLMASTFVLGSAPGFAADTTKKKEELTTEQKTEIRDRVERLKADRTKAEHAAPAIPAKKVEPKRTSKAKTLNGKATTKVSKATTKKVPAKV